MRISFFIICSVLLTVIACKNHQQNSENHLTAGILSHDTKNKKPKSENLSFNDIVGFSKSDVFDVHLNGTESFVYKTAEIQDANEHKKQGNSISYQGVSYINFPIKENLKMIINSHDEGKDWNVMPALKGTVENTAGGLEIQLDEPQKFVVSSKIRGKEHYLIVSAEKPETNIPDKNDASVLFLEPGIHKYGQAWDPFVNGIKTLYIAPGAVVEATIKAKNKEGVKILGRGILSQSFVTHAEESSDQEQEWDADWLGVVFIDSKDIEIDGVAIMSSPSYQLEVANCENVKINNVKLCGFGEHNNDGLHTYSKNVVVENSFIASNDDRICITGLYDAEEGGDEVMWDGSNKLKGVPVSNIEIRDMVFWGLDNNGGDIMLTWNGAEYAKDITIENTVSLTPTNKAFIAARHGGSADINNLNIKNVKLMHGNLFDIEIGESNYQGAGGGKIRNMTLENIEIDASFNAIGKQLIGESEVSNVEGLTLINIMTKDGKLENLNQINIKQNNYVSDITIK